MHRERKGFYVSFVYSLEKEKLMLPFVYIIFRFISSLFLIRNFILSAWEVSFFTKSSLLPPQLFAAHSSLKFWCRMSRPSALAETPMFNCEQPGCPAGENESGANRLRFLGSVDRATNQGLSTDGL